MQCRKITILLFILVGAGPVFPQDDRAASNTKDFSGKQSSEWEKIQLDLGALKGKLEAQTSIVKNLIEAKNHLKGEALDMKLEELKREYQKLRRLTGEYNLKNQEYLTKFPERGTKETRIYNRIKPKSLQALENELTIQGRVNRLHLKIQSQYPNTQTVKSKVRLKSVSQDDTKATSQDVTDQILIKK